MESANYLSNLRKKVYDELNLPNPIDLFNKQTELEKKEIELANKEIELRNLESELNKQKLELNKLNNLLKSKNANIEEKEKYIKTELKHISRDDLLPKVAEKEVEKNFILECATYGIVIEFGITQQYDGKNEYVEKQKLIVESILNNPNEYIVYSVPPSNINLLGVGHGPNSKVVITNRGKIFYRISNIQHNPVYGQMESLEYVFCDFNFIVNNKNVLNLLQKATMNNKQINCNGGLLDGTNYLQAVYKG